MVKTMLASVHIASQPSSRNKRGVAQDASLILETLVLLKKGEVGAAAGRVNELSNSSNLLKLTALLCGDPFTRTDLGLRNARHRFLAVVGVSGVVNRAAADEQGAFQQSTESIAEGSSLPLTPRQAAVLRCVKQGLTNAEAAARLGVSLNTIKWHLKGLSKGLGAKNRCALVHRAQSCGLI